MELLRIVADGLPLFKDRLDLTFYAQQRVAEEHKCALRHLFSNVYLNTTNAFIGVNASGKTSILRLISFVLDLIGSKPINHSETKSILGKTECAKFEIYFYAKSVKEICKLQTEIETLIICGEDQYAQYKRSNRKPSEYCKAVLRMQHVKSYDYVRAYFSNPAVLVRAIRQYGQNTQKRPDEWMLLDLLKE